MENMAMLHRIEIGRQILSAYVESLGILGAEVSVSLHTRVGQDNAELYKSAEGLGWESFGAGELK